MFALPCRQKGAGPQLGARGPHQCGPFGTWPDPDEDNVVAVEARLDVDREFSQVSQVTRSGKLGTQAREDYELSRTAAYLLAGSPCRSSCRTTTSGREARTFARLMGSPVPDEHTPD